MDRLGSVFNVCIICELNNLFFYKVDINWLFILGSFSSSYCANKNEVFS